MEVDDVGFVELLGTELPRLQRIARLLVSDPDVADDLVAETVARTLPKWRSGRVGDDGAYLRRVLVNLAAKRWKRLDMGRRRDSAAREWWSASADVAGDTVERDQTMRALAKLPIRRRAVVVLRFYDDLSEAEIAALMGTSVGTVKSQLSKALGQLREDLGTLEWI